MNPDTSRNMVPAFSLIEEKYRGAFIASICFHGIAVLLLIFGGYLVPRTAIQIGSGPGGGSGGDNYTVGVVEQLSGGTGMVKPSFIPKPPALLEKAPEDKNKAIPLPGTLEPKRKKPDAKEAAKTAKALANSNVIPTEPEQGSGGIGSRSAGFGGGSGGGVGVSIGAGSGGLGDSFYPQVVERRISENWRVIRDLLRLPEGTHIEVIYSFYIAANGRIYEIKKVKSSGNPAIDQSAERAISISSPLTAPPAAFRGRPIQFLAQFVYPPPNP